MKKLIILAFCLLMAVNSFAYTVFYDKYGKEHYIYGVNEAPKQQVKTHLYFIAGILIGLGGVYDYQYKIEPKEGLAPVFGFFMGAGTVCFTIMEFDYATGRMW